MSRSIDLGQLERVSIQALKEQDVGELAMQENKGWSFTNIYQLDELRNIYIALCQSRFNGNIKKFTSYCIDNVPYVEKPWTYRKVEEYLNALKNYGLLSKQNELKQNVFPVKSYSEPLDQSDIEILQDIYYSYFRFKEIHTWFVDLNVIDRKKQIEELSTHSLLYKSHLLYSFSLLSRFTDAFIETIHGNTKIFFIDSGISINGALMRFWDVYVKWGKTLGVLEKFSLEHLEIEIIPKTSLSCTYHIRPGSPEFNLYDYVLTHYGKKRVFVPELVAKIAVEKRFSVENIKKYIINEYIDNRSRFNIDSTSEIFIKVGKIKDFQSILFPLYRDTYISHLTVIQ
jgi:hypothetical protein